MQAKTISAVVRVSCMVVVVKGCLGRRRHLFIKLYRLELGILHVRDGKEVPRCLLMGGSPPNGRGIVSVRQSPCGQ